MDRPVMLSLIESSVGELNWIAPCLVTYKKMFPKWKIYVVVFSENVYLEIFKNLPLTKALHKKAEIVRGNYFISNILPLIAKNVKIVLRDYNPDLKKFISTHFIDIFPNALHAVHPHSNHVYSNFITDHVHDIPSKPSTFREDRLDLLFLNSAYDLPFWTESTSIHKIRTHGSPCYDAHWLQWLLETEEFSKTREACRSRCHQNVVLYISRGEHHAYQSAFDYAQILHWTMGELLKITDPLIFIKPHPRQDEKRLLEMLKIYPKSRWLISKLPLPLLAHFSHFVVSTWSSGIIDSLAVKRPVIEFFKFPIIQKCWRIDNNGLATSIYRELGLSLQANNNVEFKEALEYVQKNRELLLNTQLKNLKQLKVYNQNSSEKISIVLHHHAKLKNSGPEGQDLG